MTRQEMIEALVSDVEDWDLDNLIGWIQYTLRSRLDILSDEVIREEYISQIENGERFSLIE
tara:strand:+ start:294 stop:476 length:183 start_codon:yes stop_codon:yes gene_type:complete